VEKIIVIIVISIIYKAPFNVHTPF